MQTTKARARWLKGGNYPMWEVSHRDTGVKVWSDRPHDCAAYLFDRFVLPEQIEVAKTEGRPMPTIQQPQRSVRV